MGTTFYIILKGRVGVIIKLPKPGKNELEPTEVSQLNTGASFGELSLMDAQLKPRAATIMCKEDCHFAVLDKAPYQSILGMAAKKKLNSQIDFLHQLTVFKEWSRHSLRPIIYLFHHEHYKKGQVLYKEGDASNDIYLIRSGEVKFTKCIVIKPKDAEEIVLDQKSEICTFEKHSMHKIIDV